MINLAELATEVKSKGRGPRPNVRSGNLVALSVVYRQLKDLGWTCNNEVHQVDRVPVFRLGSAALWRDKNGMFEWLLETDEGIFGIEGDLEQITADAGQKAEGRMRELSPLEEAAADLVAEYGDDFGGRLARAVELAEAGQTNFPKYRTRYDPTGFYGIRECDCPDAEYRAPMAKWGCACKHCLAQELAMRVEAAREQVAAQEFGEKWERKAEGGKRKAFPKVSLSEGTQAAVARDLAKLEEEGEGRDAGYAAALRPDGVNVKGDFRRDFNIERR